MPMSSPQPPRLARLRAYPGSYDYRAQEILSAKPEVLVLFLYDHAIKGCKKADAELASNALVELIDALNFEYQEVAVGFLKLYEYCLRMVKSQNYKAALKVLMALTTSILSLRVSLLL